MEVLVKQNYSLTTDVADFVSQTTGLPYRLVYKIVGQAVNDLMERGLHLEDLRESDLVRYAEELGTSLSVNPEDLKEVLKPQVALSRRKHRGGPSEEATKLSVELFVKEWEACKGAREGVRLRIQEAVHRTASEVARVLGESERVSE